MKQFGLIKIRSTACLVQQVDTILSNYVKRMNAFSQTERSICFLIDHYEPKLQKNYWLHPSPDSTCLSTGFGMGSFKLFVYQARF